MPTPQASCSYDGVVEAGGHRRPFGNERGNRTSTGTALAQKWKEQNTRPALLG